MFKSILTLIGGIEHYGLISLGIFFGVFSAMLIWAFTLKKPYLNRMAAAPLENQPADLNSETTHE
ncbi:MAG TPA: hypothetical protein VFV96_08875 [Verrucomicrobiae bacterium]|jgi:hypothetical protein|nr:hypothetical protein [Verrucomicrobiae bacterium]